MKIFLSWSGELSHKIALELRDWLPLVIQSIQPYVSSEDIDKGTRWSVDIAKELENSSFGILCVTPQNKEAPWIQFEAGALSKSFDNSNVSPFLFGLKPSDMAKNPLLQFQQTLYEKNDVYKLINSINNSLENKLEVPKLKTTFDVWWDMLKAKLDTLLPEAEAIAPKHQHGDEPTGTINNAIEEILELTREQYKILRNPNSLLPYEYFTSILKDNGAFKHKDRSQFEIWRNFKKLYLVMGEYAPEVLSNEHVQKAFYDLKKSIPVPYSLSGKNDIKNLRKPDDSFF